MDADKYNRQVSMLCPTCGCDQFEYEDSGSENNDLVKCASCGREMSKDDLLRENSENISEHSKEMGQEILKDVAAEMRKSLKTALRGSKHIKIK